MRKAQITILIMTFSTIISLAIMGPTTKVTASGSEDKPAHLLEVDPSSVKWREKEESYWRAVLDAERFSVCRQAGTERPFSGKYCKTYSDGDYHCYCCGQKLFAGSSKFDSGTGWPSFSDSAIPGMIAELKDTSHGMIRTEVRCSRCNAHLGHLFDDGPPPSGKRYCINSICLYREDPSAKFTAGSGK